MIIQQILKDRVCQKHLCKASSPASIYATSLNFSPIPQEKIKTGTKNKMIKQAERIESILHTAIDKAAKVAVGIAKAIVTLVCLGASVSYKLGIKAREIFDARNVARPDTNSAASTEQEVNVPVGIDTKVEQQQINDARNNALNDSFSPFILKPIVKANSIEKFVSDGLKDTLSENYLAATTYRLPKNKRVRTKTHKKFKDLGVMKEHYPILMATGTLR